MGIFDDMENFIIDHFSMTKRHNIQQTFEVMNSSGQQLSLQGQIGTEQLSRQGLAGQRSQVVSVTHQGQMTSEQSSSRTQHVVSATASTEQASSRVEHSSRNDRGSVSDIQDLQRSPPLDRATVPSSPFRERICRAERAGTPVGISELHRSPQLEHVGVSSPFRSRQRTSWIEQSNMSSGCTEQKRAFSFEHVSGSPGLRHAQRNSTSSEHQRTPQSEHGPINSPFRSEHQRSTPQRESLPPNSPSRSERQRSNHSEQSQPSSSFRCECRSPQADNAMNAAIILEKQMQQGILHTSHGASSPQFVRHNIDVSIATFTKPKLVRLRSEPCTFSTTADVSARGPHQNGSGNRRRREELKRSQSFESSSPSRQESLWTGINIPNQLVITRPQLSRSRLNRKHLSLHLEGMSGDLNSLRSDPPLQFHDTHGDNIELQNNKTRARRYESFCKGICFSNRPIAINERVYVKFVETNTSWSGVLRFGFTSVNPSTLRGCDLPRYACPDLTNKPGNWAKALGERYTTSNILLHFSVNRAGDVTYGVNGEEKGIFFSGVVTSQPLWAMLDIYGNTVGVEFSHANAEIEPPANASQFDVSPLPMDTDLFNFSTLSLGNVQNSPSAGPAAPLVQWHAGIPLGPLQFHRLLGRNIRVSSDRTTAIRLRDEYCNAFVFTARPICFGETLVTQVLSVDRSFIGGLGFGLTACDPSNVDPNSLPDDSDLLLDRLEYWVVNKDVCRNPEVGDELSFYISEDGEVRYARNNQAPVTLMHVDRTLPLWAFFDVYGNIQKIKLLGTTMARVQGRLPRSQSLNNYSNIQAGGGVPGGGFVGAAFGTSGLTVAMPTVVGGGGPASMPAHVLRSNSVPVSCLASAAECAEGPCVAHPTSLPATPLSPTMQGSLEEGAADCKVCWERLINCVLYCCGHMCLCYECAMTIHRQKGLCPICRQTIKDVIKIYKS